MKTFQERTIHRINAVAEQHGMETSIAFDYANTGNIFLHEPDVHRPRGKIHFSFQTNDYCLSLEFDGRRIPSQLGRADYFDFYQDMTAATRFWAVLDMALGGREKWDLSETSGGAISPNARTS